MYTNILYFVWRREFKDFYWVQWTKCLSSGRKYRIRFNYGPSQKKQAGGSVFL